MENIITIAIGLLGQFSFLAKNPNLEPAIENLSKWVGNLFSNKHEKDKLEKLEKGEINKLDDEFITSLINRLETELKGDEIKKRELENLIKSFQNKAKQEGLTKEIDNNIIKITGNKNVALKNVSTNGGDVLINY